jgi:hypothetical protein
MEILAATQETLNSLVGLPFVVSWMRQKVNAIFV